MTSSGHKLRFAYSTINWGVKCDIPAALAEIKSCGWGAIELFGHSLDQMGTPNSLMANLDGLEVATLFSMVDLPITNELRKVETNRIRFASEVGAEQYGLVGGGRLRFRPPTEAEYSELIEFCEVLSGFGADLGVTVSYHPHVACTIETSAEIDRLVAQSQTLKLCLDASHIALVGEDPLAVLDRYWDRLGYVHLKDWGGGKFQELGRGALGIDFDAILRFLTERDFAGWVVLEQSQSDISPLESARINATYLRNLGYDIG